MFGYLKKLMEPDLFDHGWAMGVIIAIIYVILLTISAIFSGPVTNLQLHIVITVLVFVSYTVWGYYADQEFNGEVSQEKRILESRIDTGTSFTFILGPILFIVLCVPTGISYTWETRNWVGMVVVGLLLLWFAYNLIRKISLTIQGYAGPDWLDVCIPAIIFFWVIMANGVMRGLATLRLEDFVALAAISVILGLLGFLFDD